MIKAPITNEKVEIIKNTILQNPIFEGISLPSISDEIILEISTGGSQCKTAIDGLVKDIEGTSLKEDFNTLATDPNLIDNITNLAVTANTKQPTCKNNDGEISVSATGGAGTYEYKLSTSTTWQVSNVFKNLKPETYTVLVKDKQGNSGKTVITIIQNLTITINVNVSISNCSKQPTNTIIVSVSGGTPPYKYSVNKGSEQSSNTFINLYGTNIFEVEDNQGCNSAKNVNILANEKNDLSLKLKEITNTISLNCEEKEKLEHRFSNILETCFGNALYRGLITKGVKLNFKISNNIAGTKASGGYDPTSNDLSFQSVDALEETTLIHELFHAYQNSFYVGGIDQYRKNGGKGRSNIEFETFFMLDILAMNGGGGQLVIRNSQEEMDKYFNWMLNLTDNDNHPNSWDKIKDKYFYFLEDFKKSIPAYNYPTDENLLPNAYFSLIKSSTCKQ
ncbi:SprB repeat-containing protein [Emticicia sp. SJ17W-69]|uniref:SprB repeat-containing protein n=1 Tax=Emticicia sp. SJ17W-69 TaxID=3421657 RepID=UPI003EBAFD97